LIVCLLLCDISGCVETDWIKGRVIDGIDFEGTNAVAVVESNAVTPEIVAPATGEEESIAPIGGDRSSIAIGPDGKVYCEDRRSRYVNARSTTSQATLTDDPAGTYRYETLIRDGQAQAWVRNRIVARRKFGSDLVAQDSAYERGQAEDLGTLMLRTEANVRALLDRRLASRKTPEDRFTQVGWTPRRGNQWALLARKISDRVTIVHTPPGGVELTRACWIEGVSHRINARTTTWSVLWRLSPTIADPD
jgi:hypothetical protein